MLKLEIIQSIPVKLHTDEQTTDLLFKKIGKVYESIEGITLVIEIEEEICIEIKRIDSLKIYLNYNDEIKQFFRDEYNKRVIAYKESVKSGLDYNIGDDENPEITVPYNPEYIKISQGKFSLKEIYEMINGDEDFDPILDLSPDFQRNYVWDRTRKSRLIESILLNIPLPVIYLSRDSEGKYQVVDGVQRLSVINEFFSNGFRLTNLEYLKKECEWRYYNNKNAESLHPKFIRLLRTYQIDCNIIEPSTPVEVKFDIFKRLNTGGKSLNNQEIRNSVMKREVRDFIRELAESKQFIQATGGSIRPKRMQDQEMVLRFLGFYFLYERNYLNLEYKGNINSFLDGLVESLNESFHQVPLNYIKDRFLTSMDNAHVLFNEYSFRKVNIKYYRETKNLINKSLFTVISVLLTRYETWELDNQKDLIESFANFLDDNDYLNESITYGTSDTLRIDTTFMLLEEFFYNEIGGI